MLVREVLALLPWLFGEMFPFLFFYYYYYYFCKAHYLNIFLIFRKGFQEAWKDGLIKYQCFCWANVSFVVI